MMTPPLSVTMQRDDLRKKFPRPPDLDEERQSTGIGTGHVSAPSRRTHWRGTQGIGLRAARRISIGFLRAMTGQKKIQRAPELDRKRQTAGVATGGVNVRFRAHQYSTRRIDIVFRYGENSLRVPRRRPHGDNCCEKAHNTFHMMWKRAHG